MICVGVGTWVRGRCGFRAFDKILHIVGHLGSGRFTRLIMDRLESPRVKNLWILIWTEGIQKSLLTSDT